MRSFILAAGVAALAIAAPATADKGGKGGGGDKGGGPAKAERGGGGGGGKAMRGERGGGGQQARAERRGGEARVRGPERRQEARAERRPGRREVRAERRQDARADRREVRAERREERRPAARVARQEQVERRRDRQVERVERRGRRDRDREDVRVVRSDRRDDNRRLLDFGRRDSRDDLGFRFAGTDRNRGLIDGCPPGLAKKGNGCLPPGQAKKLVGQALPAAFASSLLPAYYRSYYPDNDDHYYRAGDEFIYRIDRDRGLVDGYMPLFDYADYEPDYYYVGERYPVDYVNFYNVPQAYQSYYPDSEDWLYRYGDGAIYQVNPTSGLISSIVALLAGDLAVGQALPTGYDVYNVPYAYRDEYYDTPDAWYRYNDGHIYQVDPQTRIVQAVIEALV